MTTPAPRNEFLFNLIHSVPGRPGGASYGRHTTANRASSREWVAKDPANRAFHYVSCIPGQPAGSIPVYAIRFSSKLDPEAAAYVELNLQLEQRQGIERFNCYGEGTNLATPGLLILVKGCTLERLLKLRTLYKSEDMFAAANVLKTLPVTTTASPVVSLPGVSTSSTTSSTTSPSSSSMASLRSVGLPAPTPETVARLTADAEHAAKRGFVLPPPVYNLGTPIVQMGKDNWREKRAAWEEMPLTVDGLDKVILAVSREHRNDVLVSASDLSMTDDGLLKAGPDLFFVEPQGLKQLFGMIRRDADKKTEKDGEDTVGRVLFPSAAELMVALDPDVRANVFNQHLRRHVHGNQKVQLRTRTSGDKVQVYAVAGPKYTAYDADLVASQVRDALRQMPGGGEARGSVVYNPATTSLRVNALWHAPLRADGAAGDIFKGGFTARSNDAKGGGIRGDAQLWRNLCLNLIIVAKAKKHLFDVTHRSSADDIAVAMATGMVGIEQDFGHFLHQWGFLQQTQVNTVKLWGQSFANVEAAIKWGVEEDRITAAVGRDVLAEMLLNSFNAEPGDDLASLINAITRTHDVVLCPRLSADDVTSLEEQAGRLVGQLARGIA